MATKAATYATVLPDDTPMYDPYQNQQQQQQQSRQPREQSREQRPVDARNAPAHVAIDIDPKSPGPAAVAPVTDKEQLLNKHISTNKTLTYGLLFIVALLLIVIGYQVFQQRKLTAEIPMVQQNPATSGDDPPDASLMRPLAAGQQSQPELPYPNTWSGGRVDARSASSSDASGFAKPPEIARREQENQAAREAHRNDRILKQSQHKSSAQSSGQPGKSAMSRRQGHTDEDDRRRLDTIIEENDPGDDSVHERTRAIIAEQLRQDRDNDARDESLGTGSIDVVDADTAARRDLRKAEMRASPLQDERDEALVEQDTVEDVDEDAMSVATAPINATTLHPIVVLCSQVLATGTRAGQECQRECKPGNTKCNSHLARVKK
jgi:hypothetical protein